MFLISRLSSRVGVAYSSRPRLRSPGLSCPFRLLIWNVRFTPSSCRLLGWVLFGLVVFGLTGCRSSESLRPYVFGISVQPAAGIRSVDGLRRLKSRSLPSASVINLMHGGYGIFQTTRSLAQHHVLRHSCAQDATVMLSSTVSPHRLVSYRGTRLMGIAVRHHSPDGLRRLKTRSRRLLLLLTTLLPSRAGRMKLRRPCLPPPGSISSGESSTFLSRELHHRCWCRCLWYSGPHGPSCL